MNLKLFTSSQLKMIYFGLDLWSSYELNVMNAIRYNFVVTNILCCVTIKIDVD